MSRPSQAIDQALLDSGRALYPLHGFAALSLRKVAAHAGTQPAMVHYHFGGKDAFVRAVLQQFYEQFFDRLSVHGAGAGPALPRLRAALLALGSFLREHRALVGRLLLDAAQGAPVVQGFLQANAPRHLGLLLQLIHQAHADGAIHAAVPPAQAFAFLMGAVNAPMLVVPAALQLGIAPHVITDTLAAQITDDTALAQRISLALSALAAPSGD